MGGGGIYRKEIEVMVGKVTEGVGSMGGREKSDTIGSDMIVPDRMEEKSKGRGSDRDRDKIRTT